MNVDHLANVLSTIVNADRVGKKEITIRSFNKLVLNVLSILKRYGYIEDFEVIYRSDKYSYPDVPEEELKKHDRPVELRVILSGRINKAGVIKPRIPVSKEEIYERAKKLLPARDIGVLILTTSKGILTHLEARRLGIGGRLIAYVY